MHNVQRKEISKKHSLQYHVKKYNNDIRSEQSILNTTRTISVH